MGQAIEQGSRHLGIREDARPFTEGEVSDDDDRGALVEPADEVELELAHVVKSGPVPDRIQLGPIAIANRYLSGQGHSEIYYHKL